MRGEKGREQQRDGDDVGSPPHARGKEDSPELNKIYRGITPACAGKRLYTMRVMTSDRDHPRMRGEKKVVLIARECERGSPPHARGKDSSLS